MKAAHTTNHREGNQMGTGFFGNIEKIPFKGADSTDPLSYRFYDPEEVVMGKRMEDHLRFAVAYWHSFAW